jgi:hypothetical protein
MKSINDLAIWDRDALIAWIFEMGKRLFDIKIKRTEDLLMNIPQETRRESYETTKQDAAARRRVILEILTEHPDGLTAREVTGELHRRGVTPTDERNFAAPRLTELYKDGKIRVAGKKLCPQTGRNVAVWAVRGCD